jgi:hypothetical protein
MNLADFKLTYKNENASGHSNYTKIYILRKDIEAYIIFFTKKNDPEVWYEPDQYTSRRCNEETSKEIISYVMKLVQNSA